jgi:hypothetical protein
MRKFTGHHFFAVNSWVAYALVIACSFVNWDRAIFNYNVSHPNSGQIDYMFYLDMSPDLLPDIVAHKTEIDRQISIHARNKERWRYTGSPEYWEEVYWWHNRHFRNVIQRSWQSWTLADENAFEALRAMNRR